MCGLSCGGKFGVAFLVILNLACFLFGVAMFVIGIVFFIDTDKLKTDEVQSVLNDVSFSGSIKLGDILESLPIFSMCLGVVIMIIAGLGIGGACCKVRWMLIMYTLIVVLAAVMQCVCLAMYITMKETVENKMRSELTVILDNYEGYDATVSHKQSEGWNHIFIDMDCCAVDLAESTNDRFSKTKWANNRGSKKIPVTCCQSATKKNYKAHTDAACTGSYTNSRKKGCNDAIVEMVDKYDMAAIMFCVILILVEIIAIIFACVVCTELRKIGQRV